MPDVSYPNLFRNLTFLKNVRVRYFGLGVRVRVRVRVMVGFKVRVKNAYMRNAWVRKGQARLVPCTVPHSTDGAN